MTPLNPMLPSPLPQLDRTLLSAVAKIVPVTDREEWCRGWQAELWHLHHRRSSQRAAKRNAISVLSMGILRDALWLRQESWRHRLRGTPTLCLASLLILSVVSSLFALVVEGIGEGGADGWSASRLYLWQHFERCLLLAPLVVLVAFAVAARPSLEQSGNGQPPAWPQWIKRKLFLAAKTVQVLVLAFLVSVDLWQPVSWSMPLTADLMQILTFVGFALIGLRWALQDQEQRCQHCLHALTAPARVGRPSHNLLEWNGTELNCRHGHGLLSIPEMETSWCRSSRWTNLAPKWQQASTVS